MSTNKAPGPTGIELVKSLRQFRQEPLPLLLQLWRRYGDVIRLPMGTRTLFIISHPDHISSIFQKKNHMYSKQTIGYDKMRMLTGNGLITIEGKGWLKHRKIAQSVFHPDTFDPFANAIVKATDQMLEVWDRLPLHQELDVAEQMTQLSMTILARTLFSTEISKDKACVLEKALSQMMYYVTDCCSRIFNWPTFIPTPTNIRLKKGFQLFNDFAYSLIRERRSSKRSYDDLLEKFMKTADPETGHFMSDRDIRDELVTMFAAGQTTANALSWTFYLLSKHPTVMHKVQKELSAILKGTPPSLSAIQKLSYTQGVIKESMRLFPPIWIVERKNLEEDEIGGYVIKKNSLLLFPPYLTHRRDDIWDNPEGFDPLRFSPEHEAKRPRFAYYPFSHGPRQCIGKHFAMMQSSIILAMVLQRYELQLVPGHRAIPQPGIILKMPLGLKMILSHV